MNEDTETKRPLIRPTAQKTVWILLAANVLTYGFFYVALRMVAQ